MSDHSQLDITEAGKDKRGGGGLMAALQRALAATFEEKLSSIVKAGMSRLGRWVCVGRAGWGLQGCDGSGCAARSDHTAVQKLAVCAGPPSVASYVLLCQGSCGLPGGQYAHRSVQLAKSWLAHLSAAPWHLAPSTCCSATQAC